MLQAMVSLTTSYLTVRVHHNIHHPWGLVGSRLLLMSSESQKKVDFTFFSALS